MEVVEILGVAVSVEVVVSVGVVDSTEVPMEEDFTVNRITVEDSDILDHILTHQSILDLVWEGSSTDHHRRYRHHHQFLLLTPGLMMNHVVVCAPLCD